MKKFLLFLLVCVSCSMLTIAQQKTVELQRISPQQTCVRDQFTGLEAHFSFQNLYSVDVDTEKGLFSTISLDGSFPSGADGTPELPVARKLIAVPQGATPVVVIKNFTETEYSLEELGINRLFPHQPSVRKDMKPEEVKFIYKEEAYMARGYRDRPVAQVAMMGTLRNIRIASLTVNPVIYDAASNKIRVRNNIEVEVLFEGADKAATQSLYESTYSLFFKPVYDQMLNRDVYDENPDLWNVPVRMMIVADDQFSDALQPWIAWKTKRGFYVDLYLKSQAGNTHSAIKNFIHSKYNEGVAMGNAPTFLVLVGDKAEIPAINGQESGSVSDLSYCSVDNDYFPEMYCFRMSCSNVADLQSMIEKAMVYEQVTMDPSYLGNALLIAGVDNTWNPKLGQPTMNYAHNNHFTPENNYNNIYKYLNSYTNCYSHLSTGVAVANYTAHGSETSWHAPNFSNSDVATLTNENKYFLAISNCCVTAQFSVPTCFGEAMTRANKKGAYAFIGSSPNSYWYEDYYYGVGATTVIGPNNVPTPENSSTGIYDMMNQNNYNTVCAVNFIGNLAVCYAHDGTYPSHASPAYYWEAYHIFGDGSIMPFCGVPTSNTVSHLPTMPIGVSTYEVSAKEGSYVAISKDGVLHGVGVVGASGTANIEITPITEGGNVDIVVTARNTLPYMTQVPAAALDGPFVVAESITPDSISFGETQSLTITMKNVGVASTTGNTTVTISCDDPQLSILTASAIYGVMSPNEELSVPDGFQVLMPLDVTNGKQFTVKITAVNDTTWVSYKTITAKKPVVAYKSISWPGNFEAGSSFDIAVTFENSGYAAATNAVGTLTTTDPNVTIASATADFGTIAANGEATGTYHITLSDAVSSSDILNFNISLSADNGITSEGSFFLSNECNVIFNLFDTYGDGWNGNAKLEVSFSDGSPTVNIKLTSGSTGQEVLAINSGTTVTLKWVKGSWDGEISFNVQYEDGTPIYESPSTLTAGILHTFVCNCSGGSGSDCPAPTNLAGVAQGTTAKLTWNAPSASRDIILSETFEGVPFEGIPDGWTRIDADGDGHEWKAYTKSQVSFIMPHSGTVVLISRSWQGGAALSPDNYLITPLVEGATSMTFYYAVNDYAPADHYSILASTTGNSVTDFTMVYEETPTGRSKKAMDINESQQGDVLSCKGGTMSKDQTSWFERTVELPVGTRYVAFRHHNTTDQDFIMIDDVTITSGEGPVPPVSDYTFKVYRDNVEVATVTTTSYDDANLSAGTYNYTVKTVCEGGVLSDPSNVASVTISGSSDCPSPTNLAGVAEGTTAKLTWNAPTGSRDVILSETFEAGSLPTGWTTLDEDGDGQTWTFMAPFVGHNGGGCISSASFINNVGPATPDNYLITPDITGGTHVNYFVCAQDGSWPAEHYAVMVSSSGTSASDFTIIFEETLTAKGTSSKGSRGTNAQGSWYEHTLDLPAGTKYVAFRHFNCTDLFWLNLDDVTVTSGEGPVPPPVSDYTFKVYRDNVEIATVNTASYDDANLSAGTYNYTVKTVCEGGVLSDPSNVASVTIESPVPPVCPAPTNLTATASAGNTINLNWEGASDGSETLSWSGDYSDAIGTNSAADFDVAHKFEASDLSNYVGWRVTKIAFVPCVANCTYSLRAWSGNNAETMILDQEVSGISIQTVNEFSVNTPVTIEANKAFYFGYRCNTQEGFPAGVDAGPAVTGKGDLIHMNGEWAAIAGIGLDNNFCIVTTVSNDRGEEANLVLTPDTDRRVSGTLGIAKLPVSGSLYTKDRSFSYKIYRDNAEIATVSETSFTDPNLPNGTYTYYVKTVCDGGMLSDPSNEASATVSITELEGAFNIYPNPANDKIYVEGDNIERVSLYNILGQQLVTITAVENMSTVITTSQLESGIYMLRIVTRDGGVVSQRVVVTH